MTMNLTDTSSTPETLLSHLKWDPKNCGLSCSGEIFENSQPIIQPWMPSWFEHYNQKRNWVLDVFYKPRLINGASPKQKELATEKVSPQPQPFGFVTPELTLSLYQPINFVVQESKINPIHPRWPGWWGQPTPLKKIRVRPLGCCHSHFFLEK